MVATSSTAVVALCGVLLVLGCGENPIPPGEEREALTAREEDLATLRLWVSAERSFTPDARRAALDRIGEILESGPADDLVEFYLEVASVVALADNGHSNLSRSPLSNWGFVPIRIGWFDDGLYVLRAASELEDLLGARIDSIEGMSPESLIDVFDPFHGGTADHYREYYAPGHFTSPSLLRAAGVTATDGEIRLSVTREGSSMSEAVSLTVGRPGDGPRGTNPWRLRVPVAISGETGWSWVVPDSVPFHLRDHSEPFRYAYLSDIDASYVQFRANRDQNGRSINQFTTEARNLIEAHSPRAVILDTRANDGGNLGLTADFARGLPDLIPDDGAVYVLTSHATFSAGIYTSFYPESVDPARTVVVGEHVGDRLRFWAEGNGPSRLARSRFTIGHSDGLHDLSQPCLSADCWAVQAFAQRLDITVSTLEPDEPIGTTYAQYRRGIDPLMSWVRAQLGG